MPSAVVTDIRQAVDEPTIAAAPIRVFVRFLEADGRDPKPLLAQAGLGPADISHPMRHVPLRAAVELFALASNKFGDAAYTMRFAKWASLGVMGLLGHYANNAPSVRAFLQVLAGFAPVLVTRIAAGYSERHGRGEIYWSTPPEFDVALMPCNLLFAVMLVKRVRTAVGDSWTPLSVDFEHRAPDIDQSELSIFGARVRFDCPTTRMAFDSTTLSRSMPGSDPDLFAIFDDHARLLMERIAPEASVIDRVRNVIASRLHEQSCSVDAVARELKTTQRALRRRLEASGSSFDRIVDETRRAVAERLLRETDRPLSHVAFDLGYNSQSAFTRAARRWFACSPRAYRQISRDAPYSHYGSAQKSQAEKH